MIKQVDCRKLKTSGLEELRNKIDNNKIILAVIQVEGDSASDIYVKNKKKASLDVGIELKHILLSNNVSKQEIEDIIKKLNNDKNINGIMVQLPLPKHLNEREIINYIDPLKDVDGLTSTNLGKIVAKEDGLVPCTALGVVRILDDAIGLDNLTSLKIVIIGRSALVGLPLYHILLNHDAMPVICHSKIKNLDEYTRQADIVISACGNDKSFIGKDMIKENAIVIDVSSVIGEDGKLHGDVIYDEVIKKASYVTPVPGGVGQLTVLELMENTYQAYLYQKENNRYYE